MIALDENALICDLAETYHIYDYRSLPVKLVATLSSGLREDSRIRRKMRGEVLTYTDSLLSLIYDALVRVFWNGDDDPPVSMYEKLNGFEPAEKKPKDYMVFDSPEEFERERERIIAGNK